MDAHTTVAITVLCDNHAADGLEAEHGFSLWIETAGKTILFDTGQGAALLRNAAALGLDLSRTDAVVLSHGHYDHTGNLSEVLLKAPHAQLYLHPDALLERYSIHAAPKPIGMPVPSCETVKALPEEQCRWVTAPLQIAEQVWLTGPVPRKTTYEDTGGPFFTDKQGRRPDNIADDLSLWIETPLGRVVSLGCCHAGVINTLDFICEKADDKSVFALIGGMHLLHAEQGRLAHTAEALKKYAIQQVYPCHCTGDSACDYLARRLGATVRQGYAGLKIRF